MKMKDLQIPEPCDVLWEEMEGGDKRRFCDHCTKNVHNLSEMSKDEALEVLGKTPDICVQYATDMDTEEILFKDSTSITARLYRQGQGLGKLLAAAALVVPLLVGCQEPTGNAVESEVVTPIEIDSSGQAVLKPGAGKAPSYTKVEQTTPPVEVLGGEPEPAPNFEAEKPTTVKTSTSPKKPHAFRGKVVVPKDKEEQKPACDGVKEKTTPLPSFPPPKARVLGGAPRMLHPSDAHKDPEKKSVPKKK